MKDEFNSNNLEGEELEQDINTIAEAIQSLADEWRNSPHILNMERIKQLYFCYYAMKELTSGTNAVVVCDIDEPDFLVGCVQIDCNKFECSNIALFIKVAEIADDTEIQTLTNGNIQIIFSFRNLTID